ncbi:MAG: type II secretion system F family protein [Opitutales bacterium]|nr:type II secretion system F family protein [Opitutales bacterium]
MRSYYEQWAQALEAGLTDAQAQELAEGPPKGARARLAAELEGGRALSSVLHPPPPWLPRKDARLLALGSETGKMPQTLRRLAARHALLSKRGRAAALVAIYPLFVIHAAAFIFPLTGMIDMEAGFRFDARSYAGSVLGVLLPLWIGLWLIRHAFGTDAPVWQKIMNCLPLWRGQQRLQALSDFFFCLGVALDAGISARRAWETASRSTNDTAIKDLSRRAGVVIESGGDPGAVLRQASWLPADVRALYQTGAMTGCLDANLLKIAALYEDRSRVRAAVATGAYIALLAGVAIAWMVYGILQSYRSYFDGLLRFMEM